MEPSDFAVVKREADRAIAPVGVVMVAAAALTATAGFLAVLWAWASDIPDWSYDAVSLLPDPLVALALLFVYLWGRERIKRRVISAYGSDNGYDALAKAARRGALRRYNVTSCVLAVALFVACEFYLSYLNTKLYLDEDDWQEEAGPATTEALRPYLPARSSAPAPA